MDNKLPHYSRERLLGEGGMGKVYLAQDNQLQRQVAIKELTYQPKDGEVNHALQEARLLARVNHANIIQIYNVHDEGDHISLVMEYFNSKTLTQFLLESYCTLVKKLDLLQQLSAGLAAAHKSDVIHCDLKPNNILVNAQGLLKITDFGIALIASNEINNEQADSAEGMQYGSLLYMSPEQIQKKPLDYRSDIFSFGIVAYQLVVGSHPFSLGNNGGSATDIAQRICQKTPEHAKNLMLNAPSALTDLLMEMLIQPLEHRTLTASAIENRLKHIRTALIQAEISEQATIPLSEVPLGELPLSAQLTANEYATQPIQQGFVPQSTQIQPTENLPIPWFRQSNIAITSMTILCIMLILLYWFDKANEVESKQVVILKPTLSDSSIMAPMQQDLVTSAVEDALRQAVINTKDMYLISQREVNAITKAYPDDLNKLRQATGASDIISTELECDNSRCKVSFSRLVANENNDDRLAVKSEKNWLAPIDKFNAIFSTSQMQFASLFPEHSEVNQSALVHRPINEDDYRDYIELYSQIKGHGNYSADSLDQLEALLTRSPYLYAAYGLFRETASNLYIDTRDKSYLKRLELVLQKSPPEYRYSVYHAIDSFWLASNRENMADARLQVSEAKRRGADELTILGFDAFMFFSSGKYQQAADAYTNAFKLRPSSNLLYNTAFSYWRLGDLVKAETSLNIMLKIIPNNYNAISLQANIWLLQGKLELAISAFEKIVVSLNKGTDLTNLSMAYALNKQYIKSLEFAQKALKLSPKHPVNLLNLADIEMILGNESEAISLYQKVVIILAEKDEVKSLTYLAQAYSQLNQASLAIAALNKAQTLAPESGEVAYTSAIVYSLLKENASALHHVKAALQDNIGVVWFNLPWFDGLCAADEFQQLMQKYDNAERCIN
ncbi:MULTISPECIES: serine/threonine-protein kinase [Colwellia]|uniref:Serine/threonine protein kinase n=1 Tax=Colwellia marinimaniae TaxID=1513592 RepID=A0ABQ0MYE8_9GAMM|nr:MULTISPECIES: serine/threonine-protein kinase [Colwellia]GAW97396.1 serine/threonine protein kinase [Colwellia marinimaniae]